MHTRDPATHWIGRLAIATATALTLAACASSGIDEWEIDREKAAALPREPAVELLNAVARAQLSHCRFTPTQMAWANEARRLYREATPYPEVEIVKKVHTRGHLSIGFARMKGGYPICSILDVDAGVAQRIVESMYALGWGR